MATDKSVIVALILIFPATTGIIFYLLRGVMLGEWYIARIALCGVSALTSFLVIWGFA